MQPVVDLDADIVQRYPPESTSPETLLTTLRMTAAIGDESQVHIMPWWLCPCAQGRTVGPKPTPPHAIACPSCSSNVSPRNMLIYVRLHGYNAIDSSGPAAFACTQYATRAWFTSNLMTDRHIAIDWTLSSSFSMTNAHAHVVRRSGSSFAMCNMVATRA